MSKYQRPWWLLVNKTTGLITTVQEEATHDEQLFIIYGEPKIQGLAWLIWGPVSALLMVVLVIWLAVTFNSKEQAAVIRGLFVLSLLGLPALSWVAVSVIISQLSKKYIQAECMEEARESTICLNKNRGELVYKTTVHPIEETISYIDIHKAQITYPIGERGNKKPRLTLETKQGNIILLDENLGTIAQKTDMVNIIQQAVTKANHQD